MRTNNHAEAVFRVGVVVLLVLGGIIGAVRALEVWIGTVRGDQDRVRQLMRAFRRGRVTKWYADATRTPRMHFCRMWGVAVGSRTRQ